MVETQSAPVVARPAAAGPCARTVTPDRGSPLASRTVPLIRPFCACAMLGMPIRSAASAARLRKRIILLLIGVLTVEPHFGAGIEIAAVVAKRRGRCPREDAKIIVEVLRRPAQ